MLPSFWNAIALQESQDLEAIKVEQFKNVQLQWVDAINS
jgi:hypothetical protein